MIGQTSGIEKSVIAGAAITAFTLAKFGSDDNTMVPASAVSDLLVGIFQHDAANGAEVRVMLTGISRAKAGGTITRGSMLTSDASGQVVAAAPSSGVNNQVIGRALASASSGDIIPVLLSQGIVQG